MAYPQPINAPLTQYPYAPKEFLKRKYRALKKGT
jgi:hypothetical protein